MNFQWEKLNPKGKEVWLTYLTNLKRKICRKCGIEKKIIPCCRFGNRPKRDQVVGGWCIDCIDKIFEE